MVDIPSPAEPLPPPAGQPVSPVQPVVPGQFSSGTSSAIIGQMSPGVGAGSYGGNYTDNYLKDLYSRLGLQPYEPNPAGATKALKLPDLPDMFANTPPPLLGQGAGMEGPRISGPGDLDYWLRPYSKGMKGASFQRSVHEGFEDSLIGTMLGWKEMREQIGDVVEPGYDPFRDEQIRAAGMTNQMMLFYGSQSREATRWLIEHSRERQRETEWASHGSIMDEIGSFTGGILGDPSNLLPGNIGVKAIGIAGRAGRLGATTLELRMVAASRAAYGSIGDGLRTAGLQAGVMIAERALQHQLDPTIPGDVSADIIIPSVIAGSLGVLQGVSRRYTANRLADQVLQRDFLKGTPPAPETPRTSFLGSQVIDTVRQRLRPASEFVEKIPEPLREKVKDEAKDLATEELLGQTPPSNNGNFPPGSLATDYGETRVREHKTQGHAAGFTEPHISSAYGKLVAETKLLDHEGQPIPFYHGTREAFTEFDPAKSGQRFGTSAEGGLFHFITNPELASTYAESLDRFEGGKFELGGEPHGAPNVHKVYLNVKNPVDATDFIDGVMRQDPRFREVKSMDDWEGLSANMALKNELMPDIVDYLKAQGHDAIVANTPTGQGQEVIVFNKNQILHSTEKYEAPKTNPITANNHWLDERGKPVSETPGVVTPPHTKDFEQFMAGNRMVDAEGKPIVVYHGTTQTFRDFSNEALGTNTGASSAHMGHFFASNPATSSEGYTGFNRSVAVPGGHVFLNPGWVDDLVGSPSGEMVKEGAQVRPSYLRMTNPLEVVDTGQHRTVQYASTIADAKAAGHDGVIIRNTVDGTGHITDVYVVFDPKTQIRGFDQRYETHAPNASEGAHQPGSVGAQLSPESLAYQESVLREQGRLVPTGIGLENMPLNPLMRAFQGASVSAMRFAADVASTGGLITKANAEGIANLAPVETLYQVNWNKRLVDVLRHQQDQWSAYRQKVAGVADVKPEDVNIEARSDWKRVAEQVGTAIRDKVSPGERGLSYEQFRIRVAEAQNKGDFDTVGDAATPYINATAAKFRSELYEHAKTRALETGVFDEVYRESLDKAHSQVTAIKKEADEIKRRSAFERWDPDRTRQAEEALMARMEDAEFKYNQQKKQLDNLRDNGPMLNGTAQSFRPRLWDTGALLDKEQAFFDKVVPWFQSKAGGSLDVTEAVRITKQIHELLSHQNPIFERGDMKALFQGVAGPTSAHARSFTIPDELVKDFLVNDSETLARYHVQQMGKAIEFKERFGSLDAHEQIAEIEQDYRRQIIAANAGSEVPTDLAKTLTAQMKTAIADAQALRDKYYGTYGASPDPHRWDSRTIRMAKQFNNLTLLGMSGISALGDLVRPVMTEGIDAVYGYGIRSLMSESRALIMKMNKAELELEGNGMELQLNVRALAAADTGDMFGSRGKFEHGMNQANAWMFVANGLNAVNQIDKEWAHLSVGGRVNNLLMSTITGSEVVPHLAHLSSDELRGAVAQMEGQLAKMGQRSPELAQDLRSEILAHEQQIRAIEQGTTAGMPLPEQDRGRFAAAGIGEDEARRIGLQLKIYGHHFGNITIANTTKWRDDYARDIYRSAMNQFVNRTVPTPGIGDRPNWASTEWGGLISQYKSFGMGSLIRGGISGLQEGGNRFWYGAASAVGFAIVLNEIRSQLFYDKSTFDKPVPAVIVDGIDRSGILGWFSDVNRAVETLSGHRIGVKPMLGAEQPSTPTLPQVAGTIGGPSAAQAARVVSVANDYMSGHPTAQTMRNWRALTPGGTLPYADPAMDALYGSGKYPSQSRARTP